MKKHSTLIFLAGILTAVIFLDLLTPALATDFIEKTITVYSGANIYVDGIKMEPKTEQGNPVELFSYNGTTYVPVRAVSESLGYSVKWDGTTKTVYIGEVPGEKLYFLDICPPYQSDGVEIPDSVQMAGKTYTHCMRIGNGYHDGYALFNLNGLYDSLSFDVGHVDGTGMVSATLKIFLDGELSSTIEVNGEMMPTHVDIPLYGALQMKIEFPRMSGPYAFANMEIE